MLLAFFFVYIPESLQYYVPQYVFLNYRFAQHNTNYQHSVIDIPKSSLNVFPLVKFDKFALSHVERPALSQVERPALSQVEGSNSLVVRNGSTSSCWAGLVRLTHHRWFGLAFD